MKKRTKILLIILGVIAAIVAGNIVYGALLPKIESKPGKFIYNGAEYDAINSFRVKRTGFAVGKLDTTGERVYKAKGDEGGYFLYIQNKPFTMNRTPLARTDAPEKYVSGITTIMIQSPEYYGVDEEKASTTDTLVLSEFADALFETEGLIRAGSNDKSYRFEALSKDFVDISMGMTVIKHAGRYYVLNLSDMTATLYAPLGENASAWLNDMLNG